MNGAIAIGDRVRIKQSVYGNARGMEGTVTHLPDDQCPADRMGFNVDLGGTFGVMAFSLDEFELIQKAS